jgi:chromosome segregation ATPase
VQHNRFVASLIRALATKDQQLTALRAQTRRLAPHSSPQGELSQKEIDCCSLQEPQSPGMQRAYLQARIVDLEERVGKLGEEAEREGGLRREWQSKVEELQQREQEYEARIQDLADRLLREEEEGRKWRQQA